MLGIVLLPTIACTAPSELDGAPDAPVFVAPPPEPPPAVFDSPPGWGSCVDLDLATWISGSGRQQITTMKADPLGGDVASFVYAGGELQLGHQVLPESFDRAVSAVGFRDASGEWGTTHALDLSESTYLTAIAAYEDGSVLMVGTLSGEVEPPFEPPPVDQTSMVVFRLDQDGTVRWVRQWDEAVPVTAQSMPDGSAILALSALDSLSFDVEGQGIVDVPKEDGRRSMVLIRMDAAAGALRWVRSVTGTEVVYPLDLSYNPTSDTLAVGGWLHGAGSAVFGAGEPRQAAHDPAGQDSFVAAYTGDGTFRWLSTGSGSSAHTAAVVAQADGSVVAGGSYTGPFLMRDAPGTVFSNPSNVGMAWLARISPSGIPEWVIRPIYEDNRSGSTTRLVGVGADGSILWGGTQWGRIAWGPDGQTFGFDTTSDFQTPWLARVDARGEVVCGAQLPRGGHDDDDIGHLYLWSLRLASGDRWQLAGSFEGWVTVGEGTDDEVTWVTHEEDAFVLDFGWADL